MKLNELNQNQYNTAVNDINRKNIGSYAKAENTIDDLIYVYLYNTLQLNKQAINLMISLKAVSELQAKVKKVNEV